MHQWQITCLTQEEGGIGGGRCKRGGVGEEGEIRFIISLFFFSE